MVCYNSDSKEDELIKVTYKMYYRRAKIKMTRETHGWPIYRDEKWDVPAPETPDIVATKKMLIQSDCPKSSKGAAVVVEVEKCTNEYADSRKRPARRRPLNFDLIVLMSDKIERFPPNLLVYKRKRKPVDIQVGNEAKKKRLLLPNIEFQEPKLSVTAEIIVAEPAVKVSKPRRMIRKPTMTYIHDIFTKKASREYDGEELRHKQKGVKESLHIQIQSFMSCMNNIQGEIKFSQWKGSVIDSIVGAYLAQNTNDVYSSSAFMSLAAKFPRGASRKNKHKGKAAKKKSRLSKKQDAELVNYMKKYCCSKNKSSAQVLKASDSVDWESVRMASVRSISGAIVIRGMHNNLAKRIKDCLNLLIETFGSTDMEWIREVPYEKAKKYMMSLYGLGLKTVECIFLLCLREKAFPIDRNAGRVAVRLGWVPLEQLPEGKGLHNIKVYPEENLIQIYLWQHLSQLEWSELYELHCQIITFGKVFCTEKEPNCRECPMKAECKYFASAQLEDIEDFGRKRPGNKAVHRVYVLPDWHDLLAEVEPKVLGDTCPYLFAVWKDEITAQEDSVYGTLMIPVRTANRGAFPLNGTFFQTNEVFADYESSEAPIKVPKASLTNLSTTTLYCGKSMLRVCRAMTSGEVQKCFKEGYVCFKAFNKKTRASKPLPERFGIRSSKTKRNRK